MIRAMLTTVDNPYDPFDEWNEWLACEVRLGHNSLGLLGRLAMVSDELSEADQAKSIEDAIDDIVRENVSGVFRKVTREFPDE